MRALHRWNIFFVLGCQRLLALRPWLLLGGGGIEVRRLRRWNLLCYQRGLLVRKVRRRDLLVDHWGRSFSELHQLPRRDLRHSGGHCGVLALPRGHLPGCDTVLFGVLELPGWLLFRSGRKRLQQLRSGLLPGYIGVVPMLALRRGRVLVVLVVGLGQLLWLPFWHLRRHFRLGSLRELQRGLLLGGDRWPRSIGMHGMRRGKIRDFVGDRLLRGVQGEHLLGHQRAYLHGLRRGPLLLRGRKCLRPSKDLCCGEGWCTGLRVMHYGHLLDSGRHGLLCLCRRHILGSRGQRLLCLRRWHLLNHHRA